VDVVDFQQGAHLGAVRCSVQQAGQCG